MKKVTEVIADIGVIYIDGNTNISISSISFDSRSVLDGSLFVALIGTLKNGNDFIQEAVDKGACVIVSEHKPVVENPGITYIQVKDARIALALIAKNFYDNPSKKLKLIGVTGTNGKTTTATLLFQTFHLLGYRVALLSTVENKINHETFPATHTTPDPIALHSFLAQAVLRGCTYAFMECSSHALHQKRTFGLSFAGALFTNLTHDHLDYHQTFESYANAKKGLFDNLQEHSFALANADDPWSTYIVKDTRAKKYYFSLTEKNFSEFTGKITAESFDGLTLQVHDKKINTKLIGRFNAYNILGIYATCIILGINQNILLPTITLLTPPPGRLEFIKSKSGVYAVIDYAHTPDALSNILSTLRQISDSGTRIITVIGCGGNRDKEKRSSMGMISCTLSDMSIFTSDNPRNEHVGDILSDMIKDIPKEKYICIADRSLAITHACEYAQPGDIVVVAGKGHEQYQIFSDRTVYFSDKEEVEKNLNR